MWLMGIPAEGKLLHEVSENKKIFPNFRFSSYICEPMQNAHYIDHILA